MRVTSRSSAGAGAAFDERAQPFCLSRAIQLFIRAASAWLDRKAHEHGWDVLLDAAAFVPTNPLDLSQVKPDFVPVSFYKMFGYPTGSAR